MPESVKVGPWEYAVSTTAAGHLAAESSVGSRLNGLSHAAQATIHIDPNAVTQFQRSTMIHEVIHQVFEASGWAPSPDDTEEMVCRALSTGLLGVLRENPGLVRWLTA